MYRQFFKTHNNSYIIRLAAYSHGFPYRRSGTSIVGEEDILHEPILQMNSSIDLPLSHYLH
jgi:hypothetical protein